MVNLVSFVVHLIPGAVAGSSPSSILVSIPSILEQQPETSSFYQHESCSLHLGLKSEKMTGMMVDSQGEPAITTISLARLKEALTKAGVIIDSSLYHLLPKDRRKIPILNGNILLSSSEVSNKPSPPFTLDMIVPVLGGKGGFGSNLRSQKNTGKATTNFDSCRDLSGRRIKTVNDAKKIAEFMAQEPERKRAKREDLERQIKNAQIKERPAPRFQDTAYMEKHEEILSSVSADVLAGMGRRLGAVDPDPIVKISQNTAALSSSLVGSSSASMLQKAGVPPTAAPKYLSSWNVDLFDGEDDNDDDEEEEEEHDEKGEEVVKEAEKPAPPKKDKEKEKCKHIYYNLTVYITIKSWTSSHPAVGTFMGLFTTAESRDLR